MVHGLSTPYIDCLQKNVFYPQSLADALVTAGWFVIVRFFSYVFNFHSHPLTYCPTNSIFCCFKIPVGLLRVSGSCFRNLKEGAVPALFFGSTNRPIFYAEFRLLFDAQNTAISELKWRHSSDHFWPFARPCFAPKYDPKSSPFWGR